MNAYALANSLRFASVVASSFLACNSSDLWKGTTMAELRKAPGMRERKPGVWEIYVDAGRDVLTGERRRLSRTFHGNIREAKAFRSGLLADASRGKHTGARATLDDLCPQWLEELRRRNRSPKTIEEYGRVYRHDIRPTLGQTQVTKIDARTLSDLYAAHEERGLSSASIYQIHATISSMLTQACRWGWRESNPARWATRPPVRRKRPTAPTPEEVMKLVGAARESKRPEYARVIFLAATTGIRRGELCSLRIDRNIDWDSGELAPTHSILELVGMPPYEKEGTKTDDNRNLAIDRVTLSLLQAQRVMMQERAEAFAAELVDDAYLFSDEPDGSQPWRPGAVTQYFGRLRDRVELPHLKFKQLRAFMDTYGQDLGFSLAQVALRAGHDPAVASKHYTARVSETDRKLAEALAALLWPEEERPQTAT